MLGETQICICCRQAPATPSEAFQIVPEDVVRATRFLRAGFCNRCATRGCDGIGPCKINSKVLEVRANFPSLVHAGVIAAQLLEEWLQTHRGHSAQSNSDVWMQLSSDYWCKIPSASDRKVVLDVLHIPSISGYQMRLRSLSQDKAADRIEELWSFQAQTLEEAYSECELMYRKMIEGNEIVPKVIDLDREHEQ